MYNNMYMYMYNMYNNMYMCMCMHMRHVHVHVHVTTQQDIVSAETHIEGDHRSQKKQVH